MIKIVWNPRVSVRFGMQHSRLETREIHSRQYLRGTTPPVLSASLSAQLIRLDSLTALQRRESESLTLATLQTLPAPECLLVVPNKSTHVWLYVPVQRQGRVLALRDLALDVCDLVFGLLAVELDDTRAATCRIGLACRLLSFLALGLLSAFGCRVDVGVWVQGSVVGGNDGVPDDELGGRDGGGRGGRV
jgi:hypothetical protein